MLRRIGQVMNNDELSLAFWIAALLSATLLVGPGPKPGGVHCTLLSGAEL